MINMKNIIILIILSFKISAQNLNLDSVRTLFFVPNETSGVDLTYAVSSGITEDEIIYPLEKSNFTYQTAHVFIAYSQIDSTVQLDSLKFEDALKLGIVYEFNQRDYILYLIGLVKEEGFPLSPEDSNFICFDSLRHNDFFNYSYSKNSSFKAKTKEYPVHVLNNVFVSNLSYLELDIKSYNYLYQMDNEDRKSITNQKNVKFAVFYNDCMIDFFDK